MIRDHSQEHLSAERIQAFLEGELPARELAGVEDHLSACRRCSGEVEVWQHLFGELGDLTALRPHEGFADRVMMGVRLPQPRPLAARLRDRLTALLPGAVPGEHVEGGRLQDFVEGLLPARQAARVQTHLDDCGTCSKEVVAWRSVLARLDGLEHFGPAEDFAARVMHGVRVPAAVAARRTTPARSWLAAARESFSWLGALVPHTRKAWAAVSGVAVTPMATLGLLLYTVFSHPTLTPGALVSFVGWKVTAFATTATEAARAVLLESTGLFRVYTFMESLVAAPAALAAGLLVFSGLMAAATWVLYKNLIATPTVDGHYARVSL